MLLSLSLVASEEVKGEGHIYRLSRSLHSSPTVIPFHSEEVLFAAEKNVAALKCLVSDQKVNYDYKYYQLPLPCDINVLILSRHPSVIIDVCFIFISVYFFVTSSAIFFISVNYFLFVAV